MQFIFFILTMFCDLHELSFVLSDSVDYLEFSLQLVMLTEIEIVLFLPFPSECIFPFSFLIALARTSSTGFNRHCEKGHPYLAPYLWRRRAFGLLPLSIMLAVDFYILPLSSLGDSLLFLVL